MLGNPLARKLSSFVDLTNEELQAIEAWCANPIRLQARATYIREGDRPENVCIVLDGWCNRYIDTRLGGRQIVGILLPGDMCDARAFILRAADHSLGALCDTVIASVARHAILNTLEVYPRLGQAIWWATLVDEGIARRWLFNVGQHRALSRMAHLFCELWTRARAIGFVSGGKFNLPLTQQDLGDALGMTGVHVNRTLRVLREERLIKLEDRELTLLDLPRLMRMAEFNSNYLQLERRG